MVSYFAEGYVIVQAMPPISVEGLTSNDVARLSETCREKMLEVYEKISLESAKKFNDGQFWF